MNGECQPVFIFRMSEARLMKPFSLAINALVFEIKNIAFFRNISNYSKDKSNKIYLLKENNVYLLWHKITYASNPV